MSGKKGNGRDLTWYRVKHISTVVPAVRCVCIAVWWDKKTVWHEVMPVLAIETQLRDVYEKVFYGDDYPTIPSSHEEFLAKRWRYLGEELVRGPLVARGWTEEDHVINAGVCQENYHPELGSNSACTTVPCTWPIEEDAVRLKDHIDRLLKLGQECIGERGANS